MISVIFLLSLLWLGLVLDEEFRVTRGDFAVRLAAAIILGIFCGAWLVYLLAWSASGLRVWTVVDATVLVLIFNFSMAKLRRRNLAWFKSLLTVDRGFWRAYFIFPLVLVAFFVSGVWISRAGAILYYGNFTDLSFHLSTVSAFLEQSAFPPLNPQSAAAKLSYHFMADFFSAVLARGGLPLFYALKVPMVLCAFSLGALTSYFFHQVLKQRTAGVCAGIFFFFGHIGVLNFLYALGGYPDGSEPLSLKSWESIEYHITYPYFNFLNVLVDFFEPQLPFLVGFPFALTILLVLFRKFSRAEPTDQGTYFVLAAVALLPLFHMHSFLVLAPLTGLWLCVEWCLFRRPSPRLYDRVAIQLPALALAGVAVALQFAFILSQKKSADFSGFDVASRLDNLSEIPNFLHARRLWFWIRAAGFPIILGLAGFFLAPTFQIRAKDPDRRANLALLVLFALTSGYFLLINFYRFTPSWGDSNKFFLYWDLMLCLYSARLVSRLWFASRGKRIVAVSLLLLGAILPFADEWSLRYRRGPSTLFTPGDRATAEWIRTNTPKDAVFLTANSYTHFVPALAGRRVVNGSYTRETGFGDGVIEETVSKAFREANPGSIRTVPVTHMLIGPEERSRYYINRPAMARWHKLLFDETIYGQRYSVYEVQEVSAQDLDAERRKGEIRGFVWVSELEASFVQQFGDLQFDESFDMTPLRLNNRTYDTGLGTHAPSEIRYQLDSKYIAFEADVGVDDLQGGSPASVVFRVMVDGKNVFNSGVMLPGAPHQHVAVDVAKAQVLTLIVEDAGDGNHSDHADWADAKLLLRRSP